MKQLFAAVAGFAAVGTVAGQASRSPTPTVRPMPSVVPVVTVLDLDTRLPVDSEAAGRDIWLDPFRSIIVNVTIPYRNMDTNFWGYNHTLKMSGKDLLTMSGVPTAGLPTGGVPTAINTVLPTGTARPLTFDEIIVPWVSNAFRQPDSLVAHKLAAVSKSSVINNKQNYIWVLDMSRVPPTKGMRYQAREGVFYNPSAPSWDDNRYSYPSNFFTLNVGFRAKLTLMKEGRTAFANGTDVKASDSVYLRVAGTRSDLGFKAPFPAASTIFNLPSGVTAKLAPSFSTDWPSPTPSPSPVANPAAASVVPMGDRIFFIDYELDLRGASRNTPLTISLKPLSFTGWWNRDEVRNLGASVDFKVLPDSPKVYPTLSIYQWPENRELDARNRSLAAAAPFILYPGKRLNVNISFAKAGKWEIYPGYDHDDPNFGASINNAAAVIGPNPTQPVGGTRMPSPTSTPNPSILFDTQFAWQGVEKLIEAGAVWKQTGVAKDRSWYAWSLDTTAMVGGGRFVFRTRDGVFYDQNMPPSDANRYTYPSNTVDLNIGYRLNMSLVTDERLVTVNGTWKVNPFKSLRLKLKPMDNDTQLWPIGTPKAATSISSIFTASPGIVITDAAAGVAVPSVAPDERNPVDEYAFDLEIANAAADPAPLTICAKTGAVPATRLGYQVTNAAACWTFIKRVVTATAPTAGASVPAAVPSGPAPSPGALGTNAVPSGPPIGTRAPAGESVPPPPAGSARPAGATNMPPPTIPVDAPPPGAAGTSRPAAMPPQRRALRAE